MTGIEIIEGHDCGAAEREIMAERARALAAEVGDERD